MILLEWLLVIFFFFLKDIFPRIKKLNNYQIMKTPNIIKKLCDKLRLNNDFVIVGDEEGIMF